MKVKIEAGWEEILKAEFEKDYFKNLLEFIKQEKQASTVYPPEEQIFAAFNLTPFEKLKVVIIGQDPYHKEKQANGLSFSVAQGITKPPSLQNIFKELKSDLGHEVPASGNLEKWAKQGVLLLNATLTVRNGQAGSHQKKGWETFTDAVIKKISDEKENIVFLLWGNYAKGKSEIIDKHTHCILIAAHPSPLARGAFFGSKPFSATNAFLKSKNISKIDWNLA